MGYTGRPRTCSVGLPRRLAFAVRLGLVANKHPGWRGDQAWIARACHAPPPSMYELADTGRSQATCRLRQRIFWDLSVGSTPAVGSNILEATGLHRHRQRGGRDATEYLLIPLRQCRVSGRNSASRARRRERPCRPGRPRPPLQGRFRMAVAAAMLDELGIRYEKRFTVWRDWD
jgi:hypothetical protein